MSVTSRQNSLLVAEDWTKIYQTFKNADFQSYDFENLRRTMIDYLRANYPEDFNDYIESSEFLALIDMIAFLGQSIAFRVDLNARDNFLELSERRDSILRLARTISYNAKRNIAARGLLKFATVSTTENVYDSNGINLSGQIISWNDPSNSNWYEHFMKVINAAFPNTQQFGNPSDSSVIYGIPTEQYRFSSAINGVPVFGFSKTIAGRVMNFEIVSTTFNGLTVIDEESPKVGNSLACIYRDDGKGYGASDTGFFLLFKQGTLNQGTFTISQPSSNESVDIDANNINNDDVWLYKLDQTGSETSEWTQVSSLRGNNIIYNSLNKNIRDIYSVITRAGDMISLQFSDGTFGNLPIGTYRVYYRVSNGLEYTINTQDIRSVSISLPYTSSKNQTETLTITMNLTTSSSNATATETNESIKTNAPAAYYTQNRIITGEDYNIGPLTASTQVAKVKSLNRTSGGVSRYFDLSDPSGKYSSVNLFSDDGVLYYEKYTTNLTFSYVTRTDIEGIIYNEIFDILKGENLRNLYYYNISETISKTGTTPAWHDVTYDSNSSSGYFLYNNEIAQVGSTYSSDSLLKYVSPGALVRFEAPNINNIQYYFDTNNLNKLTSIASNQPGVVKVLWAQVVTVDGDGSAKTSTTPGVLSTGFGPIILDNVIPSTAILTNVIPAWKMTINTATISTMIDLIFSNKPFGLWYDYTAQLWKIIPESELGTMQDKWALLFTTDNEYYTVTIRLLRYIFESDKQVQFYYDSLQSIYDTSTTKIVKDKVTVLSVNSQPFVNESFTVDYPWSVVSEFVGLDGYVDNKKVIVSFADSDNNGIVDNPELFSTIVIPNIQASATGISNQNKIYISSSVILGELFIGMTVGGDGIASGAKIIDLNQVNINDPIINNNPSLKRIVLSAANVNAVNNVVTFTSSSYIVTERYSINAGQEDYRYVNNDDRKVEILQSEGDISNYLSYPDGQYFYFITGDVVKKLSLAETKLTTTLDYKVYVGRDKLKFQYVHNADYNSRIDPGISNIIDVYVLTKTYDTEFRQWLTGALATKPLPPASDELYDMISPSLNLVKSITDEVVYHPVSYKVLFGSSAPVELQASFTVVKNSSQVVSDNDIKSRIISSINEFFALDNWDFGDTFYFTELSTFVMNKLAPDIANFVIVPRQAGLNFGSLFEIKSASDQIFVSGATVNDIDIVSGLTPSVIKSVAGTASSTVITQQTITSSTYGV